MVEDGAPVAEADEPTEPTQAVPEEATLEVPQGEAPAEQADAPAQVLTGDTLLDGEAPAKTEAGQDDRVAVPEEYEPFAIDGQQFSEEQVAGFATTARKLGLSQENAQEMFAAMVPTAREYLVNDLVAKSKEWADATAKDPEIGGANFEANKGIAKQAYARYATPELRAILTGSGLGNHPEVIRLFFRIGKTMQQDSGVTGSASAPATVRRRYPKSNMNPD